MFLPETLEHNGQRILTTAQLAEAYGTTAKRISENFSENSERYTESKHYYCLTGEQLKAFKNESGISGIAKTINKLYLWTEYGALLHAKSLNTDKAWEVYSFLVENYFNPVQRIQKPTSQLDILSGMIDVMKQQEERLKAVEDKQNEQAGLIQDTKSKIQSLHEVFADNLSDTFEDDVKKKVNAICKATGKSHVVIYAELYHAVNKKAGANIKQRQQNIINRKIKQGYSKTSAINTTSQLTVISSDKTLKNFCQMALKELCAEYLEF